MKNILVPVDGSSNSLRAVKFAISEAKHGRTTIHLLHVVPGFDDYGMVGAYMSGHQRRQIMNKCADAMLKRGTAALRAARVAFTVHMAVGETAEKIAVTARRLRCSSIVMGTRGMGMLGTLVLGSIATKVIHLAKVPVTLVK
jgi:nucleotide-binding universal stress UspA family protein